MRNFLAIILIALGLVVDPVILRAAMSSTDYYIYADDFSMGGGLSTGGEYSLQDTIGQSPVDAISGGSYALSAGYQFQTLGTISMSISSSSLSLGTLSATGASSTAETTVTVITDSASGYVLSVSDVSGESLTPVADDAVDGNGDSEEYGLAVSGSDADFATDEPVATSLTLASNSEIANGNATVLTFKAIRGVSSTADTYSQSITLSAVANF
ncbi:MAG: hypothetical protein A3J93_05245 [Candidatus Magasanikbacteria bacterium RIFOXYC2_FULL_42_28]|uniref:WxL domain-containing protein n=1 Tax=Candidatus Magasanikbacteria bacterium RIFOXYC2_FULL_42_28 TaxID=1798704 RepID=A0A1F6NV50_9BACT|nr:MAG: hypothetical protein A3J93_05245 [Candidatus Magasanikbacteria bacterium RIFOXYC2_FULL_42_28]